MIMKCVSKIINKKVIDRIYYQENKEKIIAKAKLWHDNNIERHKERVKKWHLENPNFDRIYHIEHREEISKYDKIYYQNNKEQENKKAHIRYMKRIKNDLFFKIKESLSKRIQIAVKKQYSNKAQQTIKLLDCTIPEFKIYIEKRFKEGMTWRNYGKEWHLDHIIACAHFILREEEQQKLCFHYTNYQPLWKEDNLIKGCKMEEELLCSIS